MGWAEVRIKHIARLSYGLGQPPPLSDSGIPIIRATNISRGKITPGSLIYAKRSDLPLDRAPLLREGEILVVRSGAYTGDSALVTEDWAGSAPGYDLRIAPTGANSRYLAYCLLSSSFTQQIDIAKSRAAQPHINAEELGEVKVGLPSVAEQRRIADFLDAETARIDRLLEARVGQRAALDERTYADVSETLIPGITHNPSGLWPWPWLPELANDKSLVRLGYVCRIQTGLTVDSGRDVGDDPVTRSYLRVANVQAGRVDLSVVAEVAVPRVMATRSTLRPGDVLMTEGGDLDKLGRGTVWRGEIPDCLHQNHVFALRPDVDRLNAEYLVLMTQTLHGRCYFESTGSKTTNLASTSSSKILGFPIPLPTITAQRELVSALSWRLETVARAKAEVNRQRDLLAERRQALITAAVTGQIDVSTASGRGIED